MISTPPAAHSVYLPYHPLNNSTLTYITQSGLFERISYPHTCAIYHFYTIYAVQCDYIYIYQIVLIVTLRRLYKYIHYMACEYYVHNHRKSKCNWNISRQHGLTDALSIKLVHFTSFRHYIRWKWCVVCMVRFEKKKYILVKHLYDGALLLLLIFSTALKNIH